MGEKPMTIEFTDRYGGHGPSWLRGCHGDCEAMGIVPLFSDLAPPDADMRLRPADPLTQTEMMAWNDAHATLNARPEGHICDGWHFVTCLDCGGTGRVSWLRSVTRVPRWFWRGVRFARFAMQPTISPPEWSWRRRFGNYLWAAFLSDLKSLNR